MTKFVSGILVIALTFALCMPAAAQSPKLLGPGNGNIGGVTKGEVIGIIVGVIAGVVIVTILVIHYSSKKRTITGCVISAQDGMTVTDENDKRVYTLSGNASGLKPGERMTLQGHKIKPSGSNPLTWETTKIAKDLGVCQP